MDAITPIKRALELQPISHDHHHGLQLCWKIRTGLSRGIALERIKKYADWFYENHLKPHFELEEKYVFTVLEFNNPLVQHAMLGHSRLHALFAKKEDVELNLLCVEAEIQAHIRFEERILFTEIQKIATKEQLEKIKVSHTDAAFVELEEDVFWL